MASVTDTLVTRYVADTSNYDAGNRRVLDGTNRLAQALPGVIDIAKQAAAAYLGLNAAIAGVGVAAFREFANYDALVKSLEAVEGGAKNAAKAIEVLRDIAKLPGLGLEEALKGFTGLRMSGLDQAQSERVIRATGNANALAGGGQAELAGVLLAIKQILSRENLSSEELNQLSERGLPVRQALIDAFGTADTEELKKRGIDSRQALEAIIVGLENLPEAANSAKNSLENLQAAYKMGMVSIGEGLAGAGFTDGLEQITKAIEDLESSGGLKLIGEGIADVMRSLNPLSDGTENVGESFRQAAGYAYALTQILAGLNNGIKNLMNQWWAPLLVGGGVMIAGNLVNTFAQEFEANLAASKPFKELKQNATFMGQDKPSLTDPNKTKEEKEKEKKAKEEADRAAKQATNHLAAIESNTRAMVDLQRHILGGGNIGAMGVTPIELSDIRRGGTGEEMVMSGIRKMMLEMGVSSFGRRGMVR